VSWTQVKGRLTFDAKSFEKDYPDLYAQYCRVGAGYRRFVVKEKKISGLVEGWKLKEVANG